MKKLLLIIVCLALQPLQAQEPQIRKSIEIFFEGFHARDTVKMTSVFAREMVLHFVSERKTGNVLSVESAAEMAKSIASIPKDVKFEERLLSWKIQSDGAMAHVWTPYEFYINGKLSHSGVNSFQLFNDNGIWKITYIIDTRRK
ncbi:MAG TPA: nuclear transport factor 2 family protein [Flavobacterium sp.]|jgi:hypothetical protein